MKFKELEKLLKKAGWTLYSTRGSHFYYVHPRQPNKGDIPIGTVKAIFKQAGLDFQKG